MGQTAARKIEVRLPDPVLRELECLIEQGWFHSRDEVIELALRKFLNSHRPELMERAIREDVDWGLRGGT
jgi:Arc/MetJ-type ribon-helix-helix transcriptional regulator